MPERPERGSPSGRVRGPPAARRFDHWPVDYVFQGAGPDGNPTDVPLSELFAPGKDLLVIYRMMFPRDRTDRRPGPAGGQTALLPLLEGPCPSCTALLDQLEGAAEHVSQRVNLAVVAKAPLERILTFARERGWRPLRLLSSAGSSYNRDYRGEVPEGQRPMLNVFHRAGGTIRHFWGSELLYTATDPGQDEAESSVSAAREERGQLGARPRLVPIPEEGGNR